MAKTKHLTKAKRRERNLLICSLYHDEGQTQEEIAQRFRLSRARIGQILYRAGLVKQDRLDGTPLRRRDAYVALRFPRPVRDAIRQEAERRGLPLATYLVEFILEELKKKGVNLELQPIDNGPPLPFDENTDLKPLEED